MGVQTIVFKTNDSGPTQFYCNSPVTSLALWGAAPQNSCLIFFYSQTLQLETEGVSSMQREPRVS